MSDNLLTSVIRAWDTDASIDMKKKIILVAPAMNSVFRNTLRLLRNHKTADN
jgi:phosphopantothenoylcysteine decarboxylase